jgi:hypothetical protein
MRQMQLAALRSSDTELRMDAKVGATAHTVQGRFVLQAAAQAVAKTRENAFARALRRASGVLSAVRTATRHRRPVRPGRNGPTACFKEDSHRGFISVPWQQSANMRRLGAVLALLASAQGFYLPGVAPTQYVKGAPVRARGDASLRAFFLL